METQVTIPEVQPGEIYAGLIDDKTPAYFLFLKEAIPDEGFSWDSATEWAASVGGELPTMAEQFFLFDEFKEKFKETMYWLSTTYPKDDIFPEYPKAEWATVFYRHGRVGDIIWNLNSGKYSACAVRRVYL